MSIVLGCAGFSLNDVRADTAAAVIEAALHGGIEEFDTARAYTTESVESHNESLLGRVLGRRGRVISKAGHFRSGRNTWGLDGRPKSIQADCERSLRALGRDCIDLYLLHWPDPAVDIIESVGALDELRTAGKVAAIGVSNVSVDQLRRVCTSYAIDAVENRLSLFSPDSLDVLAECTRDRVRFLAYSPLGGSRNHSSAALERIARSHGVSAAQVALAWLLSGEVHADPVVGATRVETARDSAAAATLTLRPDEMAELTSAFAIPVRG